MVEIAQHNPVRDAIESYEVEDDKRPYLGISQLGHFCNRYKWYSFRWAYTYMLSARLQRLYNRGHQEEVVVVQDLNRIGVVCHDVLEEQIEVVGVMGHLKGHPDGRLENVPGAEKTEHLLEAKTANERRFKEFVKFGCKETNLTYYVQCIMYMGYLGLTRCLFIVTHKDTDERHYERIEFDKETFDEYEEQALDIICAPVPPQKISERPEWYECKRCDAYGICHQGVTPNRNCRTCANVQIRDNGEWHCAVWPGRAIPVEFQRTGCADQYRPVI